MSTGKEPIRVLVVDDSPTMADAVSALLTDDPRIEVVGRANTGSRAVTLARLLRPDVITMDLLMPDLDGPWTLVALHQINPQVRCCFMSGNTGTYDVELLLRMGAAAVLQKPFSLAKVAQIVQQLLDGSARPLRLGALSRMAMEPIEYSTTRMT